MKKKLTCLTLTLIIYQSLFNTAIADCPEGFVPTPIQNVCVCRNQGCYDKSDAENKQLCKSQAQGAFCYDDTKGCTIDPQCICCKPIDVNPEASYDNE